MKINRQRLLSALLVAVLGAGLAIDDADAKRLGGGRAAGLQRQVPTRPLPQTPPQQQPQQPAQAPVVAPARTGAAAATPAMAQRRSWLGPIAGLAAGLGLAALLSHLGLGEQFAIFLMLAMLAIVAVVVVRFLLRRLSPGARNPSIAPGGMQYAATGARPGAIPVSRPEAVPSVGGTTMPAFGGVGAGAFSPSLATAAAADTGLRLPANFDKAGFERIAKMIFVRMQAANDAGDLDDLRQFSTSDMFDVLRTDIEARRGVPQKTDVIELDAEVLDLAEETGRQVVSVRFHGVVREDLEAAPEPFDEVWHFVRPTDGSREWAIAGIGQNNA